jgi:hypothetical protein
LALDAGLRTIPVLTYMHRDAEPKASSQLVPGSQRPLELELDISKSIAYKTTT